MSIRDFLETADDAQKIIISDNSIFSFTNSSGDLFCIPSDDIRAFFEYFYNNYDDLYKAWEEAPERKESIKIYEEKSFRRLYASVEAVHGLRSISSLGKSQTKFLTRLLSKLICYFSGLNHDAYLNNTLFEREMLKPAFVGWNEVYERADSSPAESGQEIQRLFKSWLLNNGASEKTAHSYAYTALAKASEFFIKVKGTESSLFLMSRERLELAIHELNQQPGWVEANRKGNGMYAAGMSKFKQFKESLESKSTRSTQLPKPFILLAGISGTGKSRFVREQAGVHGQDDNFCMVAVRPDWHEPGDLLGYVSRLSGTNKYVATDVLGFMVRAWKSLYSRGLALDTSSGQTTRLSGSASLLDAVAPYWLCLDEMNLAPVEQYFADYLSLIETRHWQHSPDGAFTYSCDALLKGTVLGELEQAAQQELARNLGLGDISPAGEDYGLWQHFLRHGIAIAPSLIVAGTVNMDETTHGFSRKVIDRAMSFDFGEFFPNDFDDYLAGSISHVPLTFARQSSGRDAVAKEAAAPSIEFLKAVNGVLQGSPFELAYRALNELLLAVDCHGSPAPGRELQAVWDDFLMQKLLPRIEGDAYKLQDGQDGNANLLTRLRDLLENQLAAIWEPGNTRPDFYRLQNGQPVTTECRSRRKIDWMLKRLERSGFTSFWP